MAHQGKGTVQSPLLAIVLLVLVGVTLWLYIGKIWWLPKLSSVHGADIDKMFTITFIGVGILFVALHGILGYFIFRYRKPAEDIPRISRKREWTVTGTVAVIVFLFDVTLAALGESAFMKAYAAIPPDAVVVEITGEQFAWTVRYPGDDGQFGRTDVHLIDSGINPLGLDESDPAAQDDIWTRGELHLPVNRPVKILLRSKDVIHSLFLPNFRVKQDAVPGMTVVVGFTPTRTGRYEIACAQLCGLGHYRMRAVLIVETSEAFQLWLQTRAAKE